MDPFKTLLLDNPQTTTADGGDLLLASNNLSDVDSVETSRDNLNVLSAGESGSLSSMGGEGFSVSDGSTSNRAERAQYGTVGAIAGLPATFVSEFVVPTSNPAANTFLRYTGSTATPASTTVARSGYVTLNTAGALQVSEVGATSSDFRVLTYSAFRSTYSGQAVRLSVSFSNGNSTTAPTIYLNGVDITASFSSATSGTPPNWMDASLDTTYFLSGFNWPAGRAPYSRVIVGALSAAEAAAYTSGTALEQAAPWTRTPGIAGSQNGPLDRPIYQPALATNDGFGRFSRLLVGMTPASNRSTYRIIGNTNTSGNQQILGGAVWSDADAVIDSVEFDTDGTPTITLGSASGGAQYVGSTALTAGLNADKTLVTRAAASTALWVGSSSTANVRTFVSGHKITGV